MDKLDFLDGDAPAQTAAPTPDAPAPEPVVEQAPVVAEATGQPRAPDGKFAPKGPEASASPAPEPQAPTIAPEAGQQQQPPANPELDALKAQVAGLTKALTATRQQARQTEPAPDPYQDFEAYQQWQEHQSAMQRADWSRRLAEVKAGEDTVSKAHEWAQARADVDPIFAQRAWASPDPYGFALEEYQRDQALSLLSDPKLLSQFQAWQAGNGPAPIQLAAASAPPPPQPVAPPPSITSAPSAGGAHTAPTGAGQAYGTIFD